MRRWPIRIALIVFVVLAILVGGSLVNQHSKAGELRRYKAELRAKGEKLSVSQYFAPPSTNADEIASREILKSIDLPEVENYPLLAEYLGAGKVRVAWRGQLHLGSTNDDVVSGDWAQVADEDRAVSAKLQKFLVALKNPAPDSGWVYRDDFVNMARGPILKMTVIRRAAVILDNEALLSLHEQRLDSAVTDLNLITKLSLLDRNDPELVTEVIRVADARAGLRTTWQALQATNWSESQLLTLQQGWEAVNLYDGLELSYLYERTRCVVIMEAIRGFKGTDIAGLLGAGGNVAPRGGIPDVFWKIKVGLIPYIFGQLDQDEESVLKYWTDVIGSVRLIKADHPLAEAKKLDSDAELRVEKQLAGGSNLRQFVVDLLQRHAAKTVSMVVQVETERRLTITAIAIKRYLLKNGAAPPNLAALTPVFLASIPIDPMSGKPLCYRLRPDGYFVLYSTGEDGHDDGGDPTPVKPGDAPDLWTGRDAVWPTAVTTEEQAAAEAAPTTFLKK